MEIVFVATQTSHRILLAHRSPLTLPAAEDSHFIHYIFRDSALSFQGAWQEVGYVSVASPGPKGDPGSVGPMGPTGPKGDNGLDGTFTARQVATKTTGAIAVSARELTAISLARRYELYRVSVDRDARVRLYATQAQRDADAARPRNALPEANSDHGVMLDIALGGGGPHAITLSPLVSGVSMEAVPSSSIPMTVDNLSTTSGPVTVTITYQRRE